MSGNTAISVDVEHAEQRMRSNTMLTIMISPSSTVTITSWRLSGNSPAKSCSSGSARCGWIAAASIVRCSVEA